MADHTPVNARASLGTVSGLDEGVTGNVGRVMLITNLRGTFQSQSAKLAADPLQPQGHEGLAALRQGKESNAPLSHLSNDSPFW